MNTAPRNKFLSPSDKALLKQMEERRIQLAIQREERANFLWGASYVAITVTLIGAIFAGFYWAAVNSQAL